MKNFASRVIVVIILSFVSVLLYFGAGFIVSFIMGAIASLIGGNNPFLVLLGLIAFGLIVASITYCCFALYKGSQGRFLVWSAATIGSISIGLLLLFSLIRFLPFLQNNQALFLAMSGLIGALVGSIQWLVFRNIVKGGYVWIVSMALCWLFWGSLLFLLMPTFD